MITINLIPDELRPKGRSPLPLFLASVFAAFIIVVIVFGAVSVTAKTLIARNELAGIKKELADLQDVVDAVKKLEAQLKFVEAKKKTIVLITQDNIVWSKHLFELALIMPDNVWLDSIEELKREREVTEKRMNPKTKREESFRKKVPYYVLKLVGYILPPEGQGEGVDLVGATLDALTGSEVFMSSFTNPIFGKITDEELGGKGKIPGRRVKMFDIEADIIRGKVNSSQPADGAKKSNA